MKLGTCVMPKSLHGENNPNDKFCVELLIFLLNSQACTSYYNQVFPIFFKFCRTVLAIFMGFYAGKFARTFMLGSLLTKAWSWPPSLFFQEKI